MAKPHHRREQQAAQQQHMQQPSPPGPDPEQLPLEQSAPLAHADTVPAAPEAPQIEQAASPSQQAAPTGVYPQPPGPGIHLFAITPSDTVALTRRTKRIYVGGTGNLALIASGDDPAGAAVIFNAVPVGTQIEVDATYVHATGTTATNLVGIG